MMRSFAAKGFDWVHAGGAPGGQEPGNKARYDGNQ